MDASNAVRILSDVTSMRALAHPTRLSLLEILREHGSLTASQCATLLDLSPKTCSYHLNQLARNGLIRETAEPRMDLRERPWRLAYGQIESPLEERDPSTAKARSKSIVMIAQRNHDLLLQFTAALDDVPDTWTSAVNITSRRMMMTVSELRDWSHEVEELTRRHVAAAESRIAEEKASATERGQPVAAKLATEGGRHAVRLISYGFPEIQR
jgi:DNA-binding transcriptional ArsR family regulator